MSVREAVKAGLEVSPWWLCFQRVSSGASSLLCLWKELYSKIALLHGERNTGRLGKRGGCFCLSVFFSSLTSLLLLLPVSCPDSLFSIFWLYLTLCLARISSTLSPSPRSLLMLWQAHCFGNMLVLHVFCFFFSFPRLEVWGMRLKDRFLTHSGLALWSRKHKWCGCLSVPLCCCPPSSSSSSLPLLHPSPSCTLCPCHSLFLFSSRLSSPLPHSQSGWSQRPRWRFPWVLTSATRHKQPTSSCGKTTWQPLLSSWAYFILSQTVSCMSLSPLFSATALILCLQIHLRIPLKCLCLLRSLVSSLTFFLSHLFFVNSPFPTPLCASTPRWDISHDWSEFTGITIIPPVISPSPNQPAECHWHRCSADQ